jgi:ArsR family transcriptional regulator
MSRAPLPPTAQTGGFDSLSRLCKAAGDPLRLEILRALRRDSFGVQELSRLFGVRQPAMSHHLKVLADAGLVKRRREGTSIFYLRAHRSQDENTARLLDAILAAADRLEPRDSVADAIQRVQAERASSSRDFFAANAARFSAQQELIAPPAQYGEAIGELLRSAFPAPLDTALELGPGEGWLLPALARRARHVVAVDNSPEMLERARQSCADQGLDNVELVLGDDRDAAARGAVVDLAVGNMVLHHTASPGAVVHNLAGTLRAGGTLLLTDLCAHDQDWVREACGDLWLGFAPEDIGHWAASAGLSEGDSLYLALRNGFRVQLRMFHHQDHKADP